MIPATIMAALDALESTRHGFSGSAPRLRREVERLIEDVIAAKDREIAELDRNFRVERCLREGGVILLTKPAVRGPGAEVAGAGSARSAHTSAGEA